MTKTQIIKANADIITEYLLDSDEDKLIEGLLTLVDNILTGQLIEELRDLLNDSE